MDSKKEIEKNNTDTSDIISPFTIDDAAVQKFIKTKGIRNVRLILF